MRSGRFSFVRSCSVLKDQPCVADARREVRTMTDAEPRQPSPPAERLAYRVKEAAQALAISRSRFYELVAAGEIRVLKDGARTLVRRSELEAFLERLETNAKPVAPKPRYRRPLGR